MSTRVLNYKSDIQIGDWIIPRFHSIYPYTPQESFRIVSKIHPRLLINYCTFTGNTLGIDVRVWEKEDIERLSGRQLCF